MVTRDITENKFVFRVHETFFWSKHNWHYQLTCTQKREPTDVSAHRVVGDIDALNIFHNTCVYSSDTKKSAADGIAVNINIPGSVEKDYTGKGDVLKSRLFRWKYCKGAIIHSLLSKSRSLLSYAFRAKAKIIIDKFMYSFYGPVSSNSVSGNSKDALLVYVKRIFFCFKSKITKFIKGSFNICLLKGEYHGSANDTVELIVSNVCV